MAYKMALVVRTDLGMGKGKIAAQCGHAASRLTLECLQIHDFTDRLMAWLQDQPPEMKIVLKIGSEKELLELAEQCLKLDLLHTVIADAGHTQVEPGSITVLGIGPDTNERIHAVVGHLKLL
jgi:PTH2 family peptidyl-tRNA hydrolase